MASEAITKNDLKAILNEVLPPTPSEYKKLLWQNPNPTAAFAAQTISLDLSGYDEIELEIAATATSPNTTTQFFKLRVGVGGLLNLAANTIPWRYVTPTSTGVAFGAGYSTQTYGASATTDNSAMVPERIYGIKHERVAPPQIELPTYSTTEQVVGTWIDGKPIYRKVITGTSTAGITSIDITSLNINFPVSMNITIHNTNGNWVFGSFIQASGTDSFNMYMQDDFSKVHLRSGSSFAFGQYWLVLEYTKTTD